MTPPVYFAVRIHQGDMTFPQLLAVWQEADRLGYDGATLYDLLAAPCLECWTTLTALSVATQRLRPIPLVLAQAYRHPALLAKMAASLDAISGGRLILGLGAGGDQRDHRLSGLPWQPTQERVARLEDGVRVIRFLWSGQEGPFRSHYYGELAGPGYPTPVQRPGPPILIGGHGRRLLLRAVARAADLCNVGFDLSAAAWEETKKLLADYCLEEGRDPDTLALSHNATVILGTSATAEAQVEQYARARGLTPVEARRRLAHALVGSPEACIARLQGYIALGISWFFLLFPDLPDLTSLQIFAQTVLPAF